MTRALVIVAHPCGDSFCHAAAAAAERGLVAAGHEVTTLDLYAVGFRAAMSVDERLAYESDTPVLDPQVEEHVDLLRSAETLVFVYPSWWSGLPAILKGWLERTLVPGVAFTFDERTGRVRPGLRHVRNIVGVSTWGSTRPVALLINDNGRRVLSRALRMACGWRARPRWLALYRMDTASADDRASFVRHVEDRLARLR